MPKKIGVFLIGAGITMLIPIVGFPLVPVVASDTAALLMFCMATLILILEGEPGRKLIGALGAGFSALAYLLIPPLLVYHTIFVVASFVASQYFRYKGEPTHVTATSSTD